MELETITLLITGGVLIGLFLGIILQHSKFCMAGMVSNFVLMRDCRQLHAYLAAITIALLGTQILNSNEIIILNDSSYLSNNIDWLGAIIGGFSFGFGTMLAGGCVGRSIVRIGEGNIGAILVLFTIGIAGSATMFGVLEPFRIWLAESSAISTIESNSSLPTLTNIPVL